MRGWTRVVVVLFMIGIAARAGGCAKGQKSPFGFPGGGSAPVLSPSAVQSANMSFADRYLSAMADEYDLAKAAAKTPQDGIMALRLKLLAGFGAMGNAVDPNPMVGLMDMAIMVELTREVAQEPWAAQMFGRERADAIVAVLKNQEADIWRIAASFLTPEQIKELHQLAASWRAENPHDRYVAGARLADFSAPKANGENPAAQLAGSVMGLVSLDPFHGLDPAVKEVEESRVLAERLFFYLRHMPILVSWQADMLFDQMLAQPQMTKLFGDVNTVAGSTTRFSDATSRFSDASAALAQTVEKFRAQLPDQQAKLVSELDVVIARQREGALQQATTQVSAQREAAIQQLGSTVGVQQDLMTRNLQGVTDQSIDKLYQRARALVLITVGAILLAFIIYRRFVVPRSEKKG